MPHYFVGTTVTTKNKLKAHQAVMKNTYAEDETRLANLSKPVIDKIISIRKLINKKNDEL